MFTRLCYQINNEGTYCLGHYFDDVPEGWNEYPFAYDTKILSLIISQFLDNQVIVEVDGDGSHYKGYIVSTPEYDDIKNMKYGRRTDFVIKPYTAFYHK